MDELNVGQKAPDFCLPDSNENQVCLKDFAGKWAVLYFYPKDNTSGCTLEAIDFSKSIAEFETLGAVVLGVSPDTPKSHCHFRDKHALKVTLLSDSEKCMMLDYGVWQLKKMYGREYHGVVRTTFLIDPNGIIVGKWANVKVPGHIETVLNQLKSIQERT